jgi:hypothetical protein
VILTSDTLTVSSQKMTENSMCPSVRTLNFTFESYEDWRKGTKINNLFEMSVSFWNITSRDVNSPAFFDYWTGPSTPFLQVADIATFLQRPLVREGISAEVCGLGWNCSFIVNFTAPGYKCEELASGVGAKAKNLGFHLNPLNTTILLPEGPFSYYADTFRGEYSDIQGETGDAGIPLKPLPLETHFGAFRTEPIIWVGFSVPADPSKPLPKNSSDPTWSTAFVPKVFGCEHHYTSYRVQFNYTSGGFQRHQILSREFIKPVMTTVFNPDEKANDGTKDNTTAWPIDQYILPRDVARYKLTAAYHSIGLSLRRFLHGSIDHSDTGIPITKTDTTQTKLVNVETYFPVLDLQNAVQGFYEDIILSFFSNPRFLSVVWAKTPAVESGTRVGDLTDTGYPCERERAANVFVYHRLDLWLVYGAALLLACVGVGMGVTAVAENGGLWRGTRFSNIVEATRGPGLDRVHGVRTDGEPAVAGPPRKVKLGYGLVSRERGPGDDNAVEWEGGTVMYGFGVAGEVRQTGEADRRSRRLSRALERKDTPY